MDGRYAMRPRRSRAKVNKMIHNNIYNYYSKIGKYQCGPMPVTAVYLGEVKLNYDGWFIYGEVNADIARWYYEKDHRAPNGRKLIDCQVDRTSVGRLIVTSTPGQPMTPWNLVQNYKPEEGTEAELAHIRHAVRQVVSADREEIFKLFNCNPDEKPEIEHSVSSKNHKR